MHNLDALAKHIRHVNTANGWNIFVEKEAEHNTYKVPAIICLIQSEITEAEIEVENAEPDDFMFELADVAIRILDFVGGYENIDFGSLVASAIGPDYNSLPYERVMLDLHRRCTRILEAYRKHTPGHVTAAAADLYAAVEAVARRTVAETEVSYENLYDFINEKVEQNSKRGYRHGGRKV